MGLDWTRVVLWITLITIVNVLLFEIYGDSIEGFNDESRLAPVSSNFWARLVPRRSDVGPELEIIGINRNKYYFSGYADVQRLSAKTDFCRMVNQGPDESSTFFACALGGTDNTSSISYKSITVKQGLKLSRDDYMNDSNGDGREDYCRIIKTGTGFEAQCNPATDLGFEADMLIDPNPPKHIKILLSFYANSMIWLRFYDDAFDYSQNLVVIAEGRLGVNNKIPRPRKTLGLVFNGVNQFLRIGDDRKLALGNKVLPRSMRAFCFWVKFEEFTNNAHIFDFGNGSGIDNVWVGIQGTGNSGLSSGEGRDFLTKLCKGIGTGTETLPDGNSGQQPTIEVTPQKLMKTTCANVDEYECKGMAMDATPPKREEINKDRGGVGIPETADMIYEIWEEKTRKQRIKVLGAFTKNKWVHVAVTAHKADSFRPDIKVYINGVIRFVQPSGFLPSIGRLTNNYLGKSNWADVTSQYANKDELFQGALFDFRVYSSPMSDSLIMDTIAWGEDKLEM